MAETVAIVDALCFKGEQDLRDFIILLISKALFF